MVSVACGLVAVHSTPDRAIRCSASSQAYRRIPDDQAARRSQAANLIYSEFIAEGARARLLACRSFGLRACLACDGGLYVLAWLAHARCCWVLCER